MEISGAEIHEILRVFVDSNLTSLDLRVGDLTLSVTKEGAATGPARDLPAADGAAAPLPPPPAVPAPAAPPAPEAPPAPPSPAAAPPPPAPAPPADARGIQPVATQPRATTAEAADLVDVTAPLVGVFYRRPAPDKPPYVEVGGLVRAGEPVCTISVMKMFTEVVAPVSGRVVEVCVEDESLVEHGQVVMRIDAGEPA